MRDFVKDVWPVLLLIFVGLIVLPLVITIWGARQEHERGEQAQLCESKGGIYVQTYKPTKGTGTFKCLDVEEIK